MSKHTGPRSLTLGQTATMASLALLAVFSACTTGGGSTARHTTPMIGTPTPAATDLIQSNLDAWNHQTVDLTKLVQWQKLEDATNKGGMFKGPGDFQVYTNIAGHTVTYLEIFVIGAWIGKDDTGHATLEVASGVYGPDGRTPYELVVNGGTDATDRQSWGGYTFVSPESNGSYNGGSTFSDWPKSLQGQAAFLNRLAAGKLAVLEFPENDYDFDTPLINSMKEHKAQDDAVFDYLSGKSADRPESLIASSQATLSATMSLDPNGAFFAMQMYAIDSGLSASTTP